MCSAKGTEDGSLAKPGPRRAEKRTKEQKSPTCTSPAPSRRGIFFITLITGGVGAMQAPTRRKGGIARGTKCHGVRDERSLQYFAELAENTLAVLRRSRPF